MNTYSDYIFLLKFLPRFEEVVLEAEKAVLQLLLPSANFDQSDFTYPFSLFRSACRHVPSSLKS